MEGMWGGQGQRRRLPPGQTDLVGEQCPEGGFLVGGKEELLNHCIHRSAVKGSYFEKVSVAVMESCCKVPIVPRSPGDH